MNRTTGTLVYGHCDGCRLTDTVAYFCLHLSDNYVYLSDLYVVLVDLYFDLSDFYVDLSLLFICKTMKHKNVFLPS